MPYALVTANQTLYDKYQATVLAFDNMQEDPTWLQDFADLFRSEADDHWDNDMVHEWTLDNITVAFIEGDHITYSVDINFTSGNLQGNVLGEGMPAGACMLASTSYVGPAPNRGRIYFSGLGEVAQSNGLWDVTVRQNLHALVESWSDGLTVDGITASLQIARRPSATLTGYVFNPVQSINVQAYTRSQRRRNPNQ